MTVFPAILAQTLAPAQEAALHYANGSAQEAARVLERALETAGTGGSDARLWGLLFALYRLEGEWQPFDALAQRFEQTFRAPAPAWMTKEELERLPAELRRGGSGYVELAGALDERATVPLEAVRQLARGHGAVNLDVTRVGDINAEGCVRLRDALLFAAEHGNGVLLTGAERLTRLLREAAEANANAAPYWLLLLEVLRLRGQQVDFQRTALEYALATGASPPEWQPVLMPVLGSASVHEKRDEPRYQAGPEAITLAGFVSAGHPQLDALPEFAAPRQYINVNVAQVPRMDYAAATTLVQLANELAGAGKVVRLIRPNALVATLLAMLELDSRVKVIEAG